MDIPGIGASTPDKINSSAGGGGSFLPLKSSSRPESFRLPDRNAGIPLTRETGKAIPLKREQAPVPLKTAGKTRNIEAEKAKLRKAAEGFEAIFIRQLLKTMRSTVPEGNLYGSGSTGEMYGDMAESSLADAMAKQGRFGIAKAIYNQMAKRIDSQEKSSQSVSPQVSPKDGE